MRKVLSEKVERGRISDHPGVRSARGLRKGVFLLRRTDNDPEMTIIISLSGDYEHEGEKGHVAWEHVSVSFGGRAKRCPTWEEMCWVKRLFFEDEEVVVQFHPPESTYVNEHPFCLHLWRYAEGDLPPLPPMVAV